MPVKSNVISSLRVALAATGNQAAITMPDSGDIEVLSPPRVHLAARRRFDLKLDLASALSGRERGEKKLKLEHLATPATAITSKLSDVCGTCMGQPDESERVGDRTRTSTTLVTQATLGTVTQATLRMMSSSELAVRLRKSRPILVIDCRPFLAYNVQHVQGSLNISCTDRFNRRRLQQGKVGVLDLLAATHGKDYFRRRHVRDIVLYDDGKKVSTNDLESESALHIVFTSLLREGRQAAVLQGKILVDTLFQFR